MRWYLLCGHVNARHRQLVSKLRDLIVLAIDTAMRCNEGISKKHVTTPAGLERYISKTKYDIAADADLLEWAVQNELRVKFDRFFTPQGFGLLVANKEAAAETFTKRVPLFPQIGLMCTGIATRNDALKTKFVDEQLLRPYPTIAGVKPVILEEINSIGQVIFDRLCRQLDYIHVDSPFIFKLRMDSSSQRASSAKTTISAIPRPKAQFSF